MDLRRGSKLTERDLFKFKMEVIKDILAKTLLAMYMTMLKIRKFEEVVGEHVSKREIICPCHLYIGEEAVKNINSSGENLK